MSKWPSFKNLEPNSLATLVVFKRPISARSLHHAESTLKENSVIVRPGGKARLALVRGRKTKQQISALFGGKSVRYILYRQGPKDINDEARMLFDYDMVIRRARQFVREMERLYR